MTGSRPAAVDLVEIAAQWLHLCASCDAGLGAPCTCTDADPRPTIQLLADEVLRLRIKLAEIEDKQVTTWSLPAEPGPEVTAVRCACCAKTWERISWPYAPNGKPAELGTSWVWTCGLPRLRWRALLVEHSGPGYPLTDATDEVTP